MGVDDSTCFKCGANAWTSCKHREAVRERPVFRSEPEFRDAFVKASGGGRYSVARHARRLDHGQ